MEQVARMRWGWTLLGVLAGAMAQAQVPAGRTGAESGVTATGAARYVVPLPLPPGTNGLAPSLAIAYDSRSGYGLLGAGFLLSGLSAIQRCPSTLAQDGRIAAVSLDTSDRLCLDGRRLRLTAGTHGSAGASYQTEVETFVRVTALGSAGSGPASFRVERRDGLIYEYGATADSRIEPADSATAREWALSRIRDREGNYVDFVYAEDVISGSYRPLRIDYTGNLLTGAAPYYSVRFGYEPRPAADVPTGYLAGGLVSTPWRLDRIEVVHVGTGRVLRTLDLAYDTTGATGRSRLSSLEECAGSACFSPTRFEWTSVPAGWSVNLPVDLAPDRVQAALPGDADGDGFDDLTYFDAASRQWMVLRGGASGFQYPAVGTGLGSDGDASQAVSADLDGDGRRDVLVPGSGGYWHRLWRTGSGGYAYSSTGVGNSTPPGGLVAADIDGDGRDDLVYVKSAGDAIYWRRNQTLGYSSFAAEAVLWTVPAGTRMPGMPFIQGAQRFRSIVRNGDVNGDGRTDLVVLTQIGGCGASPTCGTWFNRWQVLVSSGTALVPQFTFDGSAEPILADFNADGLTDIALGAAGLDWHLLVATGARGALLAGFIGPLPTPAAAPVASGKTLVIDWDGDGRTDLLQPTSTGEFRYCRSTGLALEACQPAGIANLPATATLMTLDANGDGYPDLLSASTATRLLLHHEVAPDHLVSATDGLGATSSFEYRALSKASVHRQGSAVAFPVRNVVPAVAVVATATLAGSDGPRQQAYFYEGARTHAQGRGFLGFARRTVTPANEHLVTVEDFLQDPAAFERIGAPSRITLQQRNGVPVARTAYTWGRQAFGNGHEKRAFGYPSRVTTERFELDGVRVSSTRIDATFDAFGTPLQAQRTTTEYAKGLNPWGQHVESVVLGGVVNDTANWCLGRPATIEVTRQHSLPGGTPVTRSLAQTWDTQHCRMTREVVEPSSPTLRVESSFEFDAFGNVAATSELAADQPERRTVHTWSESGRFLRSTTNPEGHVTTADWDDVWARPTSLRDPNGLVTRIDYDDFGRELRETRPDGTSTAFVRSLCGTSCATTDARYAITQMARGVGEVHQGSSETGYDAFGREVYSKEELPGGAFSIVVLRYDLRGLLSQESVPGQCCGPPARWVRYGYDALGRLTSLERPTSGADPTPAVVRWHHDGLTVSETDPVGRINKRSHDALGRVVQVVDPALARTDYEYEAFGHLARVRNALGEELRVAYDVRGLRRSLEDPDAGRWTYDYYPSGELREVTSPLGHSTRYTYDRLARPVTRTEPEGTTTWTWGTSAAQGNVGALAAVAAPGFSETYQYDSLGRLTKVATSAAGSSFVTQQTYNAVSGFPDVLTYPASTGIPPLRVRHHYYFGRLVQLSDADDGSFYWRADGIDFGGRLTIETLGNGVGVSSDYDVVTGQLLARTAGPGGGSAHQNLAFTWDSVGNLVQREDRNQGVLERFFYDSRDRLDYVTHNGLVTLDVDYDDLGNLTYKSDVGDYRYDATRKQTPSSAGANTYAHDAAGAVVDASGTTIRWLSHGLPSQLTHPGGNYSLFSYGPDRSRYRQVASAGGVVTDTVYAVGGLYERRTSGGAATHRYYIVADGRRVAVQTRSTAAAPVTVYLLDDHLRSVDGITSASGALLARTSYKAHGARRSGNAAEPSPSAAEWSVIEAATSRGFTGHEHLDNLGLVHMEGRVYDPVLGRFLSPDPVVQAPFDTQGFNRYAYVRNSPLRHRDPTGFCFNTHPAADQQALQCADQFLVTASRQQSIESVLLRRRFEQSALFASYSRAEAATGSEILYESERIPNIIVTADRPPQSPAVAPDASFYAALPRIVPYVRRLVESRDLSDLLLVAGLALALLEPTPAGEASLAAAIATSESRALSAIRLTGPAEKFVRYESNNAAFSRITRNGGVRLGTYAAPKSDGLISVTQRAAVYNLPDPMILRTEVHILRPPPNTLIIGPRPVAGGTGNEVLFPWGF